MMFEERKPWVKKRIETYEPLCPARRFALFTNDPEDLNMSDPFPPKEDSWPLGLAPSLGNPLPHRMLALTIHRDRYGPRPDPFAWRRSPHRA